jgi:DNA-binding NarL/FixJ family response regulator
MAAMKDGLTVWKTYVIATNQLAGEYLAHLVSRAGMQEPILCNSLPELHFPPDRMMFVIDSSPAPPCLPECLHRLQDRYAEARFVIVGPAHTKEESVTLLRLGVHGIVAYGEVTASLQTAVRAVTQGQLWVPDGVLQSYVQSSQQPKSRRVKASAFKITRREAQVMELAKLRLSNKEIAGILKVQESTVKYHLSNIYGKLRVDNRRALKSDRPDLGLWSKLLSA